VFDDDALSGRSSELALLDGLVGSTAAGIGRTAVIEGAPGIGKSSLLAQLRIRADAAGLRVLTARGSELEQGFPFGVVRQLFEAALRDPVVRARWTAGAAAAAGPVFDSPDGSDSSDGVDPGDGVRDASFAALHGLYWLTANAALDAPLLLAVDDLQAADLPSIRFLGYLARRLDAHAASLAVCLRTGQDTVELALLAPIEADPASLVIRLGPLSATAVTEVVTNRLGVAPGAAFAGECLRVTAGNPLLVRELLQALSSEGIAPDDTHAGAVGAIGPRAVSRTVLLRLARLSPDAVAVARVVAVTGDGASLPAVATLSGLSESEVVAATRALVGAEILHAQRPLGFVHPLIRDSIYYELPAPERELRHARTAEYLRDLGAPDEQVAAHLLMLHPSGQPWVAELMHRAARSAVQRGAPDSAVSYLRRALAEPVAPDERAQLLLELGTAEAVTNAPVSATEHLTAALPGLPNPAVRATAAGLLARTLLFTHPPARAVAVAREAAAALPPERADHRLALEAVELYAESFGAEPAPDAAGRLGRARTEPPRGGPGARMLRAVASWNWALTGGGAQECSRLSAEALAGGQLVAADPSFMTIVAISVLALADSDDALTEWDKLAEVAHQRGSLATISGLDLWRGWTWLRRGELAEAEESLRLAADDSTPWHVERTVGIAYAAALLADVLLERGDIPGARAALARRAEPAPRSDADLLRRRGELRLLLHDGRFTEAQLRAEQLAAVACRVRNPGWLPYHSLQALALHGLGRQDDAVALLERELVDARSWGAPGTLGRTLRLLGTVQGTDGIDLLTEAVEVTSGSSARLEHAKALLALGAGLRRARRPAQAREPLRRAVEAAARCGAQPLADRARSELTVAGGRMRRTSPGGTASLTPSERRVADLAASGHTNNEIAQALFVTPKTVEVHLTNTYRELGIRARTALTAALSGAGSTATS
jgi:DNA-binding CsgD family transcriptional regulator/tetratricopeptide (TPR) repeat protein